MSDFITSNAEGPIENFFQRLRFGTNGSKSDS